MAPAALNQRNSTKTILALYLFIHVDPTGLAQLKLAVEIWMWTLSDNRSAAHLASEYTENTWVQKYFLGTCLNHLTNESNHAFMSTGCNLSEAPHSLLRMNCGFI